MSEKQPMLRATAAPPAVDTVDEVLLTASTVAPQTLLRLKKPNNSAPVPAFSSILVMTDRRTFLF
jgi:hypothetical protein